MEVVSYRKLEEKDKELEAYGCNNNAQMYIKHLDDLSTQLSDTKATAEASSAIAESTHIKVSSLLKDLDNENNLIEKKDEQVNELEERLAKMKKHLKEREFVHKQVKENVSRVERDIMEKMEKIKEKKDCELKKMLDEVSPKNIDNMNRLLFAEDDEISKIRDEITVLSSHWKLKTKELQTQLEKQQKADQELKTRVLKLEFCFRDIRSRSKKFHRMDERRYKAIEELRDKLGTMQQRQSATTSGEKKNFWGSSYFKFLASSLSLLILVTMSKSQG